MIVLCKDEEFGKIWLRWLLSHVLIDVLIYISYMKRKLHKKDLDRKKNLVGKRNRYFDQNTTSEKKRKEKRNPQKSQLNWKLIVNLFSFSLPFPFLRSPPEAPRGGCQRQPKKEKTKKYYQSENFLSFAPPLFQMCSRILQESVSVCPSVHPSHISWNC